MGLSHTVSGDIASFRTPSRVPIESLKFHFLPKQAGSGDASPTNIRDISGWTGLNCGGHGVNLWDEIWEIGRINVNTGQNDNNVQTTIRSKNYIPCKPGTNYFIRHPMGINNLCLFFYDKNKNFISYGWKYSLEVTVPNNCYYLRFYLHNSYGTEYHNDVGINYPSSKKSYVKYTGNKEIPITFPNGEIIYGGYIDPVRGKLVATYAMYGLAWKDWVFGATLGNNTRKTFSISYSPYYYPKFDGGSIKTTASRCNVTNYYYNNNSDDIPHYYINSTGRVLYATLPNNMDENTVVQISSVLAEPIEYDIDPISLQAFLDHNNFWSDANDITEVTYAVTESKDILATRKKAMDFDIGHHKKIKWNQVVRDGNFTGEKVDASKWALSRSDTGSLSISDNIATWTCTGAPSYYYQTGITWSGGSVSSYNYLAIPWNHLILVKCKVRCTIPCKVRLFALVGSGAHVWAYNENIEANTWTDVVGFIPNRKEVPTGEDDGFIKRFKPCITGINNISEIVVGTEFKIKELMAFDLTQMFGLGNEPSTVEEFEHICEINGIDLTTYQPYDEGSDRWLIIP